MPAPSAEIAATELASRLAARSEEIKQATLARLTALAPPTEDEDPGYAEGLRTAVGAAVDHAIATVQHGDGAIAATPLPLLVQARLAARAGVGLDTVARRYVAAHNLISDFVLQEGAGRLSPTDLKRILRNLSLAADRLLHEAGAAYTEESNSLKRGRDRVRATQIERLLAGELIESEGLEYDLSLSHLGVLASGAGVGETLRGLAGSLGARLLVVSPAEGIHWAWLGSRQRLDPEALRAAATIYCPPSALLATGEAMQGPAGWRLTHRQARVAHRVAQPGSAGVVRYADIAILAAIREDDLLEASLRRLYLDPLDDDRERGEILRQTLRHYLKAGGNVTSAAASLGVNRNTVAARLREVEDRIGFAPERCSTELDAALRLHAALTGATTDKR